MSDDTTPEATASELNDPTAGAAGGNGSATDEQTSPTGSADGQPKRRRRRGSRGGRNRKKVARTPSGEDHTAAAADRGLTTDDVAAEAKEEAGLSGEAAPARPKIGDTRPAPKPSEEKPADGDGRPTSTRRRRRGGRGRGRGRGGGGGGGTGEVVQADLGVGDGDSALELDDDVLERRRGQTRKGRPAGRYMMCVHVHPDSGTTHMAVLEGRNLVEHYVGSTADDDTSIDGNIYLGRVQNVLPGMEAAFVDIGRGRNAVLYAGEVNYNEEDLDGEAPRIERVLKAGQPVLVQVTKDPIGAKGARLTAQVSLAGRYLVLQPEDNTFGISRRLPEAERSRLRDILKEVRPKGLGLIVRTAAEGASEDDLRADLARLQARWETVERKAKKASAPAVIYSEPELVVRVIRDIFSPDFVELVVDGDDLYQRVEEYLAEVAPDLLPKLHKHQGRLPVFEHYRVVEQIHKALERKVWLPSGGSIVIDRTEAMTVIDVNTGKFVGKANLEETVVANNLEAADEIVRQLRLRDIGGIIIIDFIDMLFERNQEAVVERLRAALVRDKTKSQVMEVSSLGLVQMTRKRVSGGLLDSFSETCPTCDGRGVVITHEI
jgi:ribonuclease E